MLRKLVFFSALLVIFSVTCAFGEECPALKPTISQMPTPVRAGQGVTFKGYVDSNEVSGWEWKIANTPPAIANAPAIANTPMFSHVFDRSGEYIVSLKVDAKNLCGEEASKMINETVAVYDKSREFVNLSYSPCDVDTSGYDISELSAHVRSEQKYLESVWADKEKRKACEEHLAGLERRLRAKGKNLLEKAKKCNELIGVSGKDTITGECKEKMTKWTEDLDSIKNTVTFAGNSLFKGFESYDEVFHSFYVGYEYVSIDKTFSEGQPRVGLLYSSKLFGSGVTEVRESWGLYGLYWGLNVQLTSSAEVSTGLDLSPGSTSPSLVNSPSINKALEFGMTLYLPFYRSEPQNKRTFRTYIGPLIEVGGLMVDERDRIDSRYYGGIRAAISPEIYADILYGKTKDIKGERIEARGQFPVYRFVGDSALFLGAIGNFGLVGDSKVKDIVRIYLIWRTKLDELVNYLSGNKGSGDVEP